MIFQALAWHAEDVEIASEEDEDEEQEAYGAYNARPSQYMIKIFGRNQAGQSASVTVTGFKPYFFIKMEPGWSTNKAFIKGIEDILQRHDKTIRVVNGTLSLVNAKEFRGFTNDLNQEYLKITCSCLRSFKTCASVLSRHASFLRGVPNGPHKFVLYESNIEPYLKFIHEQNLQPSGWIKIKAKYIVQPTEREIPMETHCAIDVEAPWHAVKPHASDTSAPFLVASFDIECTSTGGEFPVPVKSYRYMASQLYDLNALLEKNGATEYNKKNAMIAAIKYAFDIGDSEPLHKLSKVETKVPVDPAHLDQLVDVGIDDIFTAIQAKGVSSTACHPKREGCISAIASKLVELGMPALCGDRIIQIGTTFHTYGSRDICFKHIVTLGSCDPSFDANVKVESCDTEVQMLITWTKMMKKMDPDIVTGYNIFGFDFDYMHKRAEELGIIKQFMRLSRFKSQVCEFKELRLSSSALGDNLMRYVQMNGRVLIDLMKVIQRDHKLDNYKLDNVAYHFTNQNKNDVSPQEIFALQKGDAIDRAKIAAYCIQDCALCNHLVMKLEIIANNMGMSNVCLVPLEYIFMRGQGIKIFSLVMKECNDNGFRIPVAKRDISVKREEIDVHVNDAKVATKVEAFIKNASKMVKGAPDLDKHKPSALGAAIIAVGCMKEAGISLACKDFESTFKYLKPAELNAAVRDINLAMAASDPAGTDGVEEDGYEGAIVLEPEANIYMDPVAVLDYASLYPSCMISENLSPDKIVIDPKYDNLPGVTYNDIVYDLFDDCKVKVGERRCRYADGERGVIPKILMKLLAARKSTRKKMTQSIHMDIVGWYDKSTRVFTPAESSTPIINGVEPSSVAPAFNEFQIAVLDGLQNAYKVTANSLYGQMGAKTSQIYLKDIAACTTATGRNMIMMAKGFLETKYGARVIYGDTDSIFVTFPQIKSKGGGDTGHGKIMPSIELATAASAEFKKLLKAPHDLEYEKTFWPFILLSKKRYVGNLYEQDDKKFKQKCMGIVLKRRDNAQVVKNIYGGIIDIILSKQDVPGSVAFLTSQLDDMIKGRMPIEDLIITKSLKTDYKDPTRIAHKVLADRIAERDPGNKPQSNDRIPYVYVQQPASAAAKVLQGERIETPAFIKQNNLVPDYTFYITNQIMKPILQVYALVVEQLPGFCQPPNCFEAIRAQMLGDLNGDESKASDKLQTLKEILAKQLLFDPIISKVDQALVKKSMVAKKYCPTEAQKLKADAKAQKLQAKKPRTKKT